MSAEPRDDPFADLLAANDAFASGYTATLPDAKPRRGIAVVTCMDARIDPLAALGLSLGDAVVVRTAGARVTDEVTGQLAVAAALLDVDTIVVMPHTRCAMTRDDERELHDAVRDAGGPDTSGLRFATTPDPRESVREDIDRLATSGLLPGVAMAGFLLDVDTGRAARIS